MRVGALTYFLCRFTVTVADDGFVDATGGKRRSAVWQHFKVLFDDEDTSTVVSTKCKLCTDAVAVKYPGNTTNLRGHLSCCHKDEYCKMVGSIASEDTEEGFSQVFVGATTSELFPSLCEFCSLKLCTSLQAKKGTLEAILPQVTERQRLELHKRISLWLLRNRRPLTLPEKDKEFRDIFDVIFGSGYVPPSYKLVVQQMLALSAEGSRNITAAMDALREEGIRPSIAGDIWSEGGISVFGILVYYIDRNFEYCERLVSAIPFSDVRHTGVEIELATKRACSEIHIGHFREDVSPGDGEDTVSESVHCTVSDNASNIVSGWETFEGHECHDHTLALIVHTYLAQPEVAEVFK